MPRYLSIYLPTSDVQELKDLLCSETKEGSSQVDLQTRTLSYVGKKTPFVSHEAVTHAQDGHLSRRRQAI